MMDESLTIGLEQQAESVQQVVGAASDAEWVGGVNNAQVEQERAEALVVFRDFVGSFENGLQQWEVGDAYKRYCDLKPEFQESFWLTNISARNLDTKGVAVLMLSYLFGDDGSQTRSGDGIGEEIFSKSSLIRKLIERKIYRGKITDASAGDIISLDYDLLPDEIGKKLRLEYNQLPLHIRLVVKEAVRNSVLANVLVGLNIEESSKKR